MMAWTPSTIIMLLLVTAPASLGEVDSPTPNRDGSPRECRECRPVPAQITLKDQPMVYWRGIWWRADDPRWYVGPGPDQLWYGCARELDIMPRCVFSGDGLYETAGGR